MDATTEQAREAKQQAYKAASEHARVAGVGLVRLGASFAIKVNLCDSPLDPDKLPGEVAGVPIVYEVVGRIVPRAAP